MPVDYSKWDALELSDDSDIEVHPNVDKRSFIRAKQNQIHQQRLERRHRITTLRYERVVNDGLLVRIDALLRALERHRAEAAIAQKDSAAVDEVVFDSLADVVGDAAGLGDDHPPRPPEGVHVREGEQPSYSTMMGALVDQVKEAVEKATQSGSGDVRYAAYVREVGAHEQKVKKLQKDLDAELARLEREEGSKITSESIHTGFSSSHVAKTEPASTSASALATKTSKKSTAEPQLLNPGAAAAAADGIDGNGTRGSDADIEDVPLNPAPGEDEDDIEASPLAKRFGAIAFGDYGASLRFIGQHPEVLGERETDGLLVEAFNAQSEAAAGGAKSREEYARQCVHQALLLQYCRQLGRDGVGLFFQRVQTPQHQARKLFLDDVHSTYARIRDRTAELARQGSGDGEGGSGDREQIQLHAVDPSTTIHIVTPPALEQCQSDEERASRQIFDAFPPGLRRALESGSLDRVNEVLGKMSVDEAEEVVEQLGNGGMLSLEEGVIDATTDEGRKQVEEIEKTRQMPGKGSVVEAEVEEVESMD